MHMYRLHRVISALFVRLPTAILSRVRSYICRIAPLTLAMSVGPQVISREQLKGFSRNSILQSFIKMC
jgi:hypothetical protein